MTKMEIREKVEADLSVMFGDNELYLVNENVLKEESNRVYNYLNNMIKLNNVTNIMCVQTKVEKKEFCLVQNYTLNLCFNETNEIRINNWLVVSYDDVKKM